MHISRLGALLLACASAASAQQRVTIGTNVLHADQYVDLDSGTVLSRARLESARAEWRLEASEGRLELVPCEGVKLARWDGRLGADDPEPDPETFSDKAVKVEWQTSIAGITSEGRAFKALLTPPWPATFAAYAPYLTRAGKIELQVDFAIAPGEAPAMPPARSLHARYSGGRGIATWNADGKQKWRVTWFRSGVEKADGTSEVTEGRAEIEGLAEGKVYRIEVRPLMDSGDEGEPRVVPLLAGSNGPLNFRFEYNMEDRAQLGVGLDLRKGGVATGDADCTFDWSSVRAADGGGVQWLGEARANFDDTRPLPEFGYRSQVMVSEKGGVFAVRMRDGRYAKIWIDWDRRSRERDRIAEIHGLVLAGGGLRFLPPPSELRGTFAGGRVKLSWRGVTDASGYAVTRKDGVVVEELGSVREGAFEDAKPPMFGSPEYGVCWIDADGVRSAPASIRVDTWPKEYARGTAKIEWISGSFDFRTFRASGAAGGDPAAEADFHFDRNGMAAQGIPLVCEAGIAADIPGEFGRFDWKEAVGFRRAKPDTKIYIPHHMQKPIVARMLTRDGGYAHVRFEKSEGFSIKMTWVHLSKPQAPALEALARELLAKAPQPAAAEQKTFEELVAQLGAEGADEREAAEQKLGAAGLPAVRALAEVALKSEDAELRARAARILEAIWRETE